MAIEILSEAEDSAWADLSQDLCNRFEHLAKIFSPIAADLKGERVLKLQLPYGTSIIHDGQFCWDSLPPKYRDWRDAYGEIAIPLCLVTGRSVELYESVPFGNHSIPVHMLAEGEFFGLFQTFCSNFPQKRLQATAGGTSLIFFPRIGNQDTLKAWVRSAYASVQKKQWDNPWDGYSDRHLKANDTSGFYFGAFFRDLLFQMPSSPWRAEVILFPKSLLDKIKENAPAHLSTLELAVHQMRRSYERSEETVEILEDDAVGNTGHVLALRMIAHGLRPGFSPVFGSAEDENVLPASDLHRLFYGEAAPFKKAGEFYPALFRPSLKGEPSFYFLNWPYVKVKQSKKQNNASLLERSVEKSKEAEVGRARSDIFEKVDKAKFVQTLKSIAPPDLPREIAIPEKCPTHYFLDGGVVIIRPRKELSSSLM